MLLHSHFCTLASLIILSQHFLVSGLQQQPPAAGVAQGAQGAPLAQRRIPRITTGIETNPCRDNPPSRDDHEACQRFCNQTYGTDPGYHNNPWTIGRCKARGKCKCTFNFEAYGHWLGCWDTMFTSNPRSLQRLVNDRYRRQTRSSSVVRGL
nr:PREDICTED: uncharacterized protein LOC109031253 [Bemisia tabaci]